MIGQTLGHYKIFDKLGAGGMGEVYLAEDTTLKRQVALKVLPPDLAASQERLERFQREAETLAALDHPNIVHIYTVEQAEDVHFLTMQLVEGKPLSELIPKGGMPLERIFEIAIPLADALATAHEKGVIHRDLKPANIMVTDEGRVKVLDFGLAKLRKETEIPLSTELPTEPLTEEGRIVGTMPYMSPEQLEGKEIDARSDIFSLGVVLYELATGERPFRGDSSASLIMAIGRDTPPDVDSMRTTLPHHLGRVIRRCLEKNPERRFQSAKDVRNELEDLDKEESISGVERVVSGTGPAFESGAHRSLASGRGLMWMAVGAAIIAIVVATASWLGRGSKEPGAEPPATTPPVEASIAVLSFVDLSPGQDQEYFSDGLTEELLSLLTQIPELRVAGRSSSFQFKGEDADLRSIGEKLDVATILEGSVRKAGDQVRISAQLVNAQDGFQIWSATYDRELDDIFAVQESIAESVVEALKVPLLGQVAAATRSWGDNPAAYNLVLEGRYLADKQGEDDLRRAAELYEQALEMDPGYALAWASLAESYSRRATQGYVPFDEGYDRAREAANRAIEADHTLAEGWATLGRIRRAYDWDWIGADEAFARALELEPANTEVVRGAASLAANLGRLNQAVELSQRAVELDPLLVSSHRNLGLYSYFAGRLDQARSALEKALELNPELRVAHTLLGRVYLAWSRPEQALEQFHSEPHPAFRVFGLALAHHALGQEQEAQAALDELIETWGAQTAYQIAEIYAFQGDPDKAFEWLERAIAERDPGTAETKVDPLLVSLQDDPRWPAFLRKMRLAG
jgi:serine/threonine-protein kinase